MPSKPGVYIYKDFTGRIIYVGKAKNLRERVRSYFQPLGNLGFKTARLVANIASIEHIEVLSEVEALLLESKLIKKFKPHYNIVSKDDKSPYYIHISKEKYPKPIINHEPRKAEAGPFLNSAVPRKILRQFRSVTPFHSNPLPAKRPCFYSHIGLCRPCPGEIQTAEQESQYKQNIARLKRLIHGQFSQVSKDLHKQMVQASKSHDFETAASIRDRLASLTHLLAIPISPDEYLANPNLVDDLRQSSMDSLQQLLKLFFPNIESPGRIEMYDMSHLAGDSATGAMTVAINGNTNSKLYRHFTIKSAPTNSDVDMMKEVLTRRLKRTDWPMPNLIVLDGGKSQLSVLNYLDIKIPTIGLAKKDETIVVPAQGDFQEFILPRDHPGLKLLQRLRDEAHRFSRRLHHKHRRKKTLSS